MLRGGGKCLGSGGKGSLGWEGGESLGSAQRSSGVSAEWRGKPNQTKTPRKVLCALVTRPGPRKGSRNHPSSLVPWTRFGHVFFKIYYVYVYGYTYVYT